MKEIKEIGHGAFASVHIGIYEAKTILAVKDFRGNISQPEAAAEILFY